MTPARSTLFSAPEPAARVAVTLGALAVYRLGAAVPLPGLDVEQMKWLFHSSSLATERASVFALGVGPLVTVLFLVEIARLLSKRFNDWGYAAPANARRINRWVLIGALLVAAVQAHGIAVAFEDFLRDVDDPGPQFRLSVVTALVGGTALIAWLATLISRHGVGNGLWLLLLTPWFAELPARIRPYAELVQAGMLSQGGAVSIIAYVLIAVACFAALGLVLARRGMPLDRVLIWPLYIGAVPVIYLPFFPFLLPDGPLRDTAGALFSWGAPLYLTALAVIIIAVFLAEWRRSELRSAAAGSSATPADPAAAAPVALTALALAAVAVVPYLLVMRLRLELPLPVDGIQIAAAVVITLGVKSLLPGHRA
jgi:preprotein translocase subunit SecY